MGAAPVPKVVEFNVSVFLSNEMTISTTDTLVDSFGVWMTPAATYTPSRTITLRAMPKGHYFLGISADPDNALPELIESNNVARLPTDIELLSAPLSCGGCATTPSSGLLLGLGIAGWSTRRRKG